MKNRDYDICIVGGCGRVGLPLGIAFAGKGLSIALHDTNKQLVKTVNDGNLPYKEEGAEGLLESFVEEGSIYATCDSSVISKSEHVIVTIGTPLDSSLQSKDTVIDQLIGDIVEHLDDDQMLILRSTLSPGTTERIGKTLERNSLKTDLSYCPERISEGEALKELGQLPQIVAGKTERAFKRSSMLFQRLTDKIISLKPVEAELAKLMTNTWRYVNFAISNQFYCIANSNDCDFYEIREAMIEDYPRMKSFAAAGLTAGPCLPKDTMHLSNSYENNSSFLQSAMKINEGMTTYIIDAIKQKYDITSSVIGIVGMAFKGDVDDTRDSLAYKLRGELEIESSNVLSTDPYIDDPTLVELSEIKEKADIVILAAPHSVYKNEDWNDKIIIDIWNFYRNGGQI